MPIEPLGEAGASDNPLPRSRAKSGFASQPSEHQERELNIHDLVVRHPHAVFYFRAAGPGATPVQIFADDVLVVDRVEPVSHGALVVAVDGDEFIVRWLRRIDGRWYLVSDAESGAPILIEDSSLIFGVVTHVIHAVPRRTWEAD